MKWVSGTERVCTACNWFGEPFPSRWLAQDDCSCRNRTAGRTEARRCDQLSGLDSESLGSSVCMLVECNKIL